MIRPHAHPDVELNFLASGGPLHYRRPEGKTAVKRCELLAFWAGMPHQLVTGEGIAPGIWATIPLSLILEWDLPENFAARLLGGEFYRSSAFPGDTELMNRWIADFEAGDPYRLRVLLLELQACLHRLAMNGVPCRSGAVPAGHWGGERHLSGLVGFMAANYRNPLSVESIAEAVGLHPRYAMRLFRKNFHMSMWEYLSRLRVYHARTLLALTKRKIIDVAMDCGFASSSAFYAAYRKYSAGKPPADLRREAKPTGRIQRKRASSNSR